MKAMILAAGKGTRVRPLTYDLPKPMIPILGKPVMEYLVEHLAKYGVKQIMVNVSYLHEKIESYFGDGRRFGVEIGYSFEGELHNGEMVPQPIGSAGGMRKIQDFGGFFDETTLVICGDALIDLDIGAALFEHRAKGAIASIVTKQVAPDEVSNYGIVVTDATHRVLSFQEKPSRETAQSDLASTGIYLFEPQVLDFIPAGQSFDIGSELFPLLVARGLPLYAQKRFFNWVDIGQIPDYWAALQRVMMGEVAEMEIPGTQIRDGVWVGLNTRIADQCTITGPVYIGSNCRIAPGSEIVGPTWIGHGCDIGENARIVKSILFEYARAPKDSTLTEVIVSGNYCVDRYGHSLEEGEGFPLPELVGSSR